MARVSVRHLQGDCLKVLRTLPDRSVHCCVTSPPYWGLRDYGTGQWEGGDEDCNHLQPPLGGVKSSGLNVKRNSDGSLDMVNGHSHPNKQQFRNICGKCGARHVDKQLGLEATPQEYVSKMVAVFAEVHRVLRDDGTCWVNLGDSYGAGGRSGGQPGNTVHNGELHGQAQVRNTIRSKDLIGIPWRVAFALQTDGWYLRSDIIWHKPNPMPESVTDRPTKSHEYIFLLVKSENYYYDAEAIKEFSECDRMCGPALHPCSDTNGNSGLSRRELEPTRNKRSVWTVPSAPYSEAHFATFPPDLIKPCVLAGCPKECCPKCGAPWERVVEKGKLISTDGTKESYRPSKSTDDVHIKGRSEGWTPNHVRLKTTTGWEPSCDCNASSIPGTVLDPFGGSGTTGMVAVEFRRNAILIELNPEYMKMQKRRCDVIPGMGF